MTLQHQIQNMLSQMPSTTLLFIIIGAFVSASLILLALAVIATRRQKSQSHAVPVNLVNQDIEAIAGENVMTTQLDLARAYIEMGKKALAHNILEHVATHGDSIHQREANELITTTEAS